MSYSPPPPERPRAPASPYTPPAAPSGTYSPDGRWFWDGQQWQPVAAPGPEWARPYAPADARATAAMTLVGVATAGSALFFLAEGLDLVGAAGVLGGSTFELVVALFQGLAVLVFLSGYAGGAIAVPMWMHRCFRNLPALGATPRSWSPRWAVGGWFIPFASLVIPFMVVREMWARSVSGPEREWPLVPLWWAAWIAATLLQLASNETSRASRAGGDALGMLNDVASVAAGVLLILVVRQVTRAQRTRYAQLYGAGAC